MFSKSLRIVHDFCRDSSLHGINKAFHNLSFKTRIIWILIVIIAYVTFSYYLFLTINLHLFKKPVQTDIRYTATEDIEFPDVTICPVLPNLTALENTFPADAKRTLGLLTSLVENPIYFGFRSELSRNISRAFELYPNLEEYWGELWRMDQTAPFMARRLSKFLQ